MVCPLPDIVAILGGPTACGKSTAAIAAAERQGWAIISADSMQVYRGMAIGTGVVPEAERRGVPHELLGMADPREEFHAARFVREAHGAARRQREEHGRRSLVVGGTGLWIQALREGLMEGPGRDDAFRDALRARIAAEGTGVLHAELARVDPPSAARITPADQVRIVRALEVLHLTGRPLSSWLEEDQRRRASLGPLLPLLVMDRPAEELDRRIELRIAQMLHDGWLEEARALAALGLPDHAPARKALGYRELFAVLAGECSLEEARARIELATRQFSRRQRTWFRGRKDARWLAPAEVEQALAALA